LPIKDLSRLYAYYNARLLGGTVLWDSGSTIRTVVKAGRKLGVCRESLWPYEIAQFDQHPSAACYKEGRKHQITAYQRLTTLDEIRACLVMGLPVVFGFAVYEHVLSEATAKTGVLRVPEQDERMLGGHAILAVGYNDNTKTVLFRNSWGAAWGQSGYGTMPYEYFTTLELASDFWSVQATENDLYAACRREENEAMV
jgi:C1A family cysteine protease